MTTVPTQSEVEQLVSAVLSGAGASPIALRQAVEALAARRGGAERSELPLPPELEAYVITVADQAYAVTDQAVADLKAAGYSEAALFELTVSAALGAARARLERGLTVLAALP